MLEPLKFFGSLPARWLTDTGPALRTAASGDDVRQQFALKPDHLILQEQLALFQALDLELIERAVFRQTRNDVVKVAVFYLQLFEPA